MLMIFIIAFLLLFCLCQATKRSPAHHGIITTPYKGLVPALDVLFFARVEYISAPLRNAMSWELFPEICLR